TFCGRGNVNEGYGSITDVLTVNGKPGSPGTRVVTAPVRGSLSVRLAIAPAGPTHPNYALWVWNGPPAESVDLAYRGTPIGCTINPTPLNPATTSPPFSWLHFGRGAEWCGSSRTLAAPQAPFPLTRARGFGRPITLTLQGVMQDNGSSNSAGLSVTNAVVLVVG